MRLISLYLLVSTLLIGIITLSHGHPKKGGRIVGGMDADPGEFPFMLSQLYPTRHNCGASILSANWVLIAANCVVSRNPSNVFFAAGTNDFTSGGTRHQAKKFIIHEAYNSSNDFINDIAVVEVEEPFIMSDLVQPITLPLQGEITEVGSLATVAGWGRLYDGGPVSEKLQEVESVIRDHEYCTSVLANASIKVFPTQICSDLPEYGQGACAGDGGSPLLVDGVAVGIVSWVQSCGRTKFLTLSTDLAQYRDWIRDKTGV